MSAKSAYKGAPPKYLNDFSKALASEVRILLQEVGKLRDERRQLQFEIAELMALKSKHGAGGEYAPDWKPKMDPPPAAEPPPPPEPAPAVEAKPGWRTVHKRPERKPKEPKALPAPQPPAPPPEPPKNAPMWTTWRPNPLVAPTPKPAAAAALAPAPTPRPVGLFGTEPS